MNENENACNFISSHGIMKSCNLHYFIANNQLNSNVNFQIDSDIDIIYIRTNQMPVFFHYFKSHPEDKPFILVTGDCDEVCPIEIFNEADFIQFMELPKLIHWFSQNCILLNHHKLSQIPIGLDYHTLSPINMLIQHETTKIWGANKTPKQQENELDEIRNNSPPFWERFGPLCYSNFHFSTYNKYGNPREQAMKEIPQELMFYEPEKTSRRTNWENQVKFAFVVSPHGNGLDCHRTWEALCLGCIVIVQKSSLDALYENLPVLIVENWRDITPELLNSTIETFKEKQLIGQFKYEKLLLNYWMNIINSQRVLVV